MTSNEAKRIMTEMERRLLANRPDATKMTLTERGILAELDVLLGEMLARQAQAVETTA